MNGGTRNLRQVGSVLDGGEIPLLEIVRGPKITIETQSTTPAGWYTDPAGSGGKRWWDGVQWTAHLQAVTPPPPPSFVSASHPAAAPALPAVAVAPLLPAVQEPQRIDPYTAANPYGLPAVQERPYTPMQHTAGAPVQYAQVRQGTRGASIGYIIVGAIAFGLSLIGLMPGSPVFYYSAGGIIAIVGGVRALLRARGYGESPIAPIAGIVLGSLAVICMVIGIISHTSVSASFNSTPTTQSQGGTGTGTPTGPKTDVDASVPASPVFAADQALTSYEASAAAVAQGIYGGYSSGKVVDVAMNWPTTLQQGSDGSVTLPNGTIAAKIPVDQVVKIEVSKDGKYFGVFVSGGPDTEVAVYDSDPNKFTWVCEKGAPASCPSGGLSAGSGADSTNS